MEDYDKDQPILGELILDLARQKELILFRKERDISIQIYNSIALSLDRMQYKKGKMVYMSFNWRNYNDRKIVKGLVKFNQFHQIIRLIDISLMKKEIDNADHTNVYEWNKSIKPSKIFLTNSFKSSNENRLFRQKYAIVVLKFPEIKIEKIYFYNSAFREKTFLRVLAWFRDWKDMIFSHCPIQIDQDSKTDEFIYQDIIERINRSGWIKNEKKLDENNKSLFLGISQQLLKYESIIKDILPSRCWFESLNINILFNFLETNQDIKSNIMLKM
jgi:hypothetical protein